MSGDSFCDCQVQEGPRGWGVSGGMRGGRRDPWCEIPEDFRGKKRRGREGAWRIRTFKNVCGKNISALLWFSRE